MKKYLFFLPILIFVSSCTKETVFNTVNVNEKYSISIPDYMKPCADLHKDASLQYQNPEKEIYTMVIDERKKMMVDYDLDYDLDLYYKNIASQAFIESIKDGKISPPGRQEINGHKALTTDITGNINGTDVFYRMGIIETPYAFYQVLTWTRTENKDKYMADMIKIFESFKEIPQPASELPEPKINPDSVTIQLAY